MPELWTNNARSTLLADITSGATSLSVASGHGALFPSPTGSDYFYLTLEKSGVREIVKCTARATDALTITRAQQGTSAAAFTAGARVELRLTKQSLEDLQSVGSITAAYASRPAAGVSGRLFLPNDGLYVERDSGSAWVPWGPIFPMTPPVDGGFSWVNQGSASVSTTNGGIRLAIPASASTIRLRYKTAPSPPYKITAWLIATPDPVGNSNFGIGFRQSSDGKNHVFVIGPTIASQKLDGVVFNSNYAFTTLTAGGPSFLGVPVCLRIEDNNTNRILSYSFDGIEPFTTYHSIGRTDFLTADQVLFWGSSNATFDSAVTLLSWKEA